MSKNKNETLASIERKLNLSQGSIRKWEKQSPSIDKVKAIANFFEISIDDLIENNGILSNRKNRLTEEEQELLSFFNCLSEKQKLKEIGRLELLVEEQNKEEIKKAKISI